MFRLTREVRFGINPEVDDPLSLPPTNGFAGYPSLLGVGHYMALEITLVGEPSAATGCVVDIRQIDRTVRELAIPLAAAFVQRGRLAGGCNLLTGIFERLKDAWPGTELHHLRLNFSPFLTITLFARELPMIRLSQKFEFSASHRLHNEKLSDQEVTLYSRYRDVGGGVQWPLQMRRERNGEKVYEIYSESVAINQDLTDDLFTAPNGSEKITQKPKKKK